LILDFYNEHITANHLDVGVGTGYFLDKCRFPSDTPRIMLLDLNPNSLNAAAKRLHRYQPITHLGNVWVPEILQPLKFDSIALNFLLHCLHRPIGGKQYIFRNLKPLLNPGGVVFGTTILGRGIKPNFLARRLMRLYNAKGIFSNTEDTLEELENSLKTDFRAYSTKVVGCVAFFVGSV
jgi:hypothetical protein